MNTLRHAQTTDDGTLLHVDTQPVPHPFCANLEAHIATVRIPLTPIQQLVLREIQNGAGTIRYSIRSALAQLGIDGFDVGTTTLDMEGTSARVTTLLSDWRRQTQSDVLRILADLSSAEHPPKIARLVLLPHEARLSVAETGLAHMKHDEHTLALPLADEHYRIRDDRLTAAFIWAMLSNGSAREHMTHVREKHEGLPSSIEPGEFFLGGVDISPQEFHLALRQHTAQNDGQQSPLLHGHSCFFDAGRCHRQVETRHTGRKTIVTLEGISILAEPYRAQVS